MARRHNAPTDRIERIEAEGEWVDLLTNNVSVGKFAELASGATGVELNYRLLAYLIRGWSFTDETGASLPINTENIRDNDDAPVILEVLRRLPTLPFLARLSLLTNRES